MFINPTWWSFKFFKLNETSPAFCACAFPATGTSLLISLSSSRWRFHSRAEARGDILTSQRTVNFTGWPYRYGAELPAWVAVSHPACNVAPRPGCRGYQPLRLSSSDHRSVFLACYSIRWRWGREISRGRMLVFDLGKPCLTPRWRAQRLLLHHRVFIDVFDKSTASLHGERRRKKNKWERNIARVLFCEKVQRWWIKLINEHV